MSPLEERKCIVEGRLSMREKVTAQEREFRKRARGEIAMLEEREDMKREKVMGASVVMITRRDTIGIPRGGIGTMRLIVIGLGTMMREKPHMVGIRQVLLQTLKSSPKHHYPQSKKQKEKLIEKSKG
ncbi:hypothetical protein AMTR_s00011p00108600 [Amborella trichopoda]|uniref:Uncharacterized protein n=1 Tax=Amborella trichopoda TaxID=13333 RepID=W1NHD5_AMBTC|nr:hypothetical protein AMTR_s00011p00108600 [Amborella trichopoda]